jgi:sporulation protein YlmC with PRC-barrel domain
LGDHIITTPNHSTKSQHQITTPGVHMSQQTQNQSAQEDVLIKLGDTELVLNDSSADTRNHKVIDSEGKDIGHVSALYIDRDERKTRFLQVGTGGFLGLGEQQFLVPVEGIARTTEDTVYLNHSQDHIVKSPPYDASPTTQRNSEYWNHYYGYYGHRSYWDNLGE